MKKMKKAGVLVSAIATTAVCASMIAGSTFALFTSEDQVDITVSSGNVSITADVNGSIKTPVSIKKTNDGYEIGEYETSTSAGFNATSDGLINVTNVIPGDKVELTVGVENTGSVKAKYNFTLECVEGVALMNKLVVDVEEDTVGATDGVKKYTSDWAEIDAGAKATYNLTLQLPAELDSTYANLSTKIKTTVFAVQYNADMANPVSNVEKFPVVEGVEDLTDGGLLVLSDNLTVKGVDPDPTVNGVKDYITIDKDTEIDLGGKTWTIDNKLFNVVDGADLVVSNGKIVATNSAKNGMADCAFNVYGNANSKQASLTLDNVDIESYGYGLGIRNFRTNSNEPLVTVNGGTITTSHPYACAVGTSAILDNNTGSTVYTGGSVIMNGTTINSNGSGIMLTVPVAMELNNCTINSRMQCLVIRAGNVTLNGCTLNNNIYDNAEYESAVDGLSYSTGYMSKKYIDKNITEQTYWGSSNNTDLAAIVLGNRVAEEVWNKTEQKYVPNKTYDFDCKVTVIDTVINQKNGINSDENALVYIHGDARDHKAEFNYSGVGYEGENLKTAGTVAHILVNGEQQG